MSDGLKRIPVIIDTDPGVDDICALLLALSSPELVILAITITFGNTNIKNSQCVSSRIQLDLLGHKTGSENVLKLWYNLHRHFERHPEDTRRFPIFAPAYEGDIPYLACGSEAPLQGELYNAEYFHGRDGLADISTRHPELSVPKGWQSPRLRLTGQSAIELSLDLIRLHPARSVTYIALGPLTNLARMMQMDATLVKERIGRVIAMGGALDVPGNVSTVAEFNFYADPFAVREVLHPQDPGGGLPLNRFILLPLDITTQHELSFPSYKKSIDPLFGTTDTPSRSDEKSPLVHFCSSCLEHTVEVMRKFRLDIMELHDAVAVWCAICNPPVANEERNQPLLSSGWVTRMRRFQIERVGELTRGMLVVDRRQTEEGKHDPVVEVDPKIHWDELLPDMQAVAVVTGTPGSDVLARTMADRIWGLRM